MKVCHISMQIYTDLLLLNFAGKVNELVEKFYFYLDFYGLSIKLFFNLRDFKTFNAVKYKHESMCRLVFCLFSNNLLMFNVHTAPIAMESRPNALIIAFGKNFFWLLFFTLLKLSSS